jgi:hypothetical protein
LTAVADAGWLFNHWSGNLNGSNNPEIITMNSDKEITAHFMYPSHDTIVFTAHQGFSSRIYLTKTDGSIIKYYEYSNARLLDLEVVNNEIYVVEAFNPLIYKLDIDSGNLETIISDPDLYIMYGLAFDGTYFYVEDSYLNRYDINGNKESTASFNEIVLGAAWDGVFYWTLNDAHQIKCWDISSWPIITPGPYVNITPPSKNCRGLWFDGLYFWSAEYIENNPGNIYQFDYNGEIIHQWVEPAFKGWSACTISTTNKPPNIPVIPLGPISGNASEKYNYTTSTNDPEGHLVYYKWDWGYGPTSDWIGPYNSGETITLNHSWPKAGYYEVKVKAKDMYGAESNWSETLLVDIIDVKLNFLIGRISNFTEGPLFCTFNAKRLLWLSFPPFETKYYHSGENLSIRSDYGGTINDKNFFICLFIS